MHLYGLSSVRVSSGLQSPYNTKSVNRYDYKELGGCNIWFESLFERMFHGHMYLDNNRPPTEHIHFFFFLVHQIAFLILLLLYLGVAARIEPATL